MRSKRSCLERKVFAGERGLKFMYSIVYASLGDGEGEFMQEGS